MIRLDKSSGEIITSLLKEYGTDTTPDIKGSIMLARLFTFENEEGGKLRYNVMYWDLLDSVVEMLGSRQWITLPGPHWGPLFVAAEHELLDERTVYEREKRVYKRIYAIGREYHRNGTLANVLRLRWMRMPNGYHTMLQTAELLSNYIDGSFIKRYEVLAV